jgi:exo-beta-1,3-glucanase (GH17 family)
MPKHVTAAQIRHDLTLLAGRYDCVRTYTVSNGMDQVPRIAAEFGLQVLLGAWIGRDPLLNEAEISRVLRVAREHRENVRAIVVGNEVLLRHELTPSQLATLIRRVGAESGLPVTYADVWGYWVHHRAVADAVSFVTVHIIPYWDDDPVGIDEVIPYVDRLYDEMRLRFPGKQVLIGETGWPSVGRPRGANVPGHVNQARYIREFTALAAARGIPYNLIEAFDQPWKRLPEGTVGGYWGLQDVRGRPKFPFSGPVTEQPGAASVLRLALGLGLLGAVMGVLGFPRGRVRAAAMLASTGVLAATLGARQWLYLSLGNINAVDWAVTTGVACAGWLALVRVLRLALAAPGVAGDASVPRGAVAAWRSWRRRGGTPVPAMIDAALRFGLLACASYVSLGLAFAGRHRDFPVWLFLPAVLAFVSWAMLRPHEHGATLRNDRAIEEWLMAAWLVPASVLIPWAERFSNVASVAWGLSALCFALAVLVPVRLQAPGHQQTAQHAHT